MGDRNSDNLTVRGRGIRAKAGYFEFRFCYRMPRSYSLILSEIGGDDGWIVADMSWIAEGNEFSKIEHRDAIA